MTCLFWNMLQQVPISPFFNATLTATSTSQNWDKLGAHHQLQPLSWPHISNFEPPGGVMQVLDLHGNWVCMVPRVETTNLETPYVCMATLYFYLLASSLAENSVFIFCSNAWLKTQQKSSNVSRFGEPEAYCFRAVWAGSLCLHLRLGPRQGCEI